MLCIAHKTLYVLPLNVAANAKAKSDLPTSNYGIEESYIGYVRHEFLQWRLLVGISVTKFLDLNVLSI